MTGYAAIASYCVVLESLFTTDNSELSHKIAECLAFFCRDLEGRKTYFDMVKRAYRVRSSWCMVRP